MTDFAPGQTITVDVGAIRETAVIATVGTVGATTVAAATGTASTVIPVTSPLGFSAGQTVSIDSGANQETAVVGSITVSRGSAVITVVAPFTHEHAAGVQVFGSDITLKTALSQTHASGVQVASELPTPGAPNHYYVRAH